MNPFQTLAHDFLLKKPVKTGYYCVYLVKYPDGKTLLCANYCKTKQLNEKYELDNPEYNTFFKVLSDRQLKPFIEVIADKLPKEYAQRILLEFKDELTAQKQLQRTQSYN